MVSSSRWVRVGSAALTTVCLVAACNGSVDDSATPSASSETVLDAATTAPDDVAPVSTEPTGSTTGTDVVATVRSESTDVDARQPLQPLPPAEPVAFSLPPTFAAQGTDVPVVVSVGSEVDASAVEVRDDAGELLAELTAMSSQFWSGSVPGASVTGSASSIVPVARTADGALVEGDPASFAVMTGNGTTLQRREVVAETTVVYDRPWSGEPGELDLIPAPGEGVSVNPPGLARVDEDQVAVLDVAAQRVTCFDLVGDSTCTVPLPVDASGDMFPLGDGTLAVIDLRARDGDQELNVLRVDPSARSAEVVYHEHPLRVAGFSGIASNITLVWDAPSNTAWVSVPEGGPRSTGEPDPGRFPYTDALHIEPDGVVRGPTVQRPALRPDIAGGEGPVVRLLDGYSWVTFYDEPRPFYDVLAREVTASGVVWMLVGIGGTGDDRPTVELARWRPGDAHFDSFAIDFNLGDFSTRSIAAMDDETVVVLDVNVGGRLRAFDFPALDRG